MSAETLSLASLAALGPTRAAALWLERLQRDDAGADDGLFRQWLEANDANRAAWDRALDLWDSFEEPGEDEALASLRREALAFPTRRTAPVWLRYAVAASLVAAASIGWLVAVDSDRHASQQQSAQVDKLPPQPDLGHFGGADYATAVGQQASVVLRDGTRVRLDTNSAVDVAYAGDLRLVRLVRGQAFFDVAHDPAQPFRVAAGGRVVAALGTRFNVRLAAGETRVLLVEGSVLVTKGDDPAEAQGAGARLMPGQQLIARPGRPDEIASVDVERQIGWRRGVVQFDNDTLSAAAAELNRYSSDQLVIRDPAIAGLRISGSFRTGDTARFAQTLTALYPVRVIPAGEGKLEITHQR